MDLNCLKEKIVIWRPEFSPPTVDHQLGEPKQATDIDHFHVSLHHAHGTVLRATAAQPGMTRTGQVPPCAGCVEAKGRRAATVPGTVHLDLTGRHVRNRGGSRYMLAGVDSKTRFMMIYGLTRKEHALAKVTSYMLQP